MFGILFVFISLAFAQAPTDTDAKDETYADWAGGLKCTDDLRIDACTVAELQKEQADLKEWQRTHSGEKTAARMARIEERLDAIEKRLSELTPPAATTPAPEPETVVVPSAPPEPTASQEAVREALEEDESDDGLRLGLGAAALLTRQAEIPGLSGPWVERLEPTATVRFGDEEGMFAEVSGAPLFGHFKAYGLHTQAVAGMGFGLVEFGAVGGFTNYGIWADKSLPCCDVAYRGFDLGARLGITTSGMLVALTGSVQPRGFVETTAGKSFPSGGQPTLGVSATWFLGQRDE